MSAADRRRRQIEDLCHSALERAPAARAAFVATACSSDEDLRREVEALLAHAQTAEGFLGTPLEELVAATVTGQVFAAGPGILSSGQEISHYRILEVLGAGGMGVVYRARDTKLHRPVAIKLLIAGTFRQRLLAEARAAAALNHPHICTIHEVCEEADRIFIVMEYLEGQPLTEAIRAGEVTIALTIRYGAQIADALSHAHDRGVVHRDVKGGNVVVLPGQRVKLVDFGIAAQQSNVDEFTRSSVARENRTMAGTLPYMAPELLCGMPADSRSDVWSLGVVLYEMATGLLPFTGRTSFEVAAAILERTPATLPASVPESVQNIIKGCLTKDSNDRYQRARDVQVGLEALSAEANPNASLARLFALSPDMICVVGFDGYMRRVNPAWTLALGWSVEELLSRPFYDFVHPDDQNETRARAVDFVTGNRVAYFTNRYRCRDGSYRWLEWAVAPPVVENLVYAVARDVTGRREADRQRPL